MSREERKKRAAARKKQGNGAPQLDAGPEVVTGTCSAHTHAPHRESERDQ